MALTDVAIRSAKPKKALQKISDGEGLQLWVQPNGSKLWRMAYRFAGKQKSLAFGTYPDVSLAEARKKRDEAKALLAAGTDPGQQKRIDKLTRAISNATTFRAVAEEYLDKQKREERSETTIIKNLYLLEQAFPFIGERPVAEIKAPEVLAVLKHLERKGTLETAKRVRGTIGAVIRYAIATARAENDPTTALAGAIIAPKVKHRAAILDPAALGAFLRAVEKFEGQFTTKAALRLLPLVFSRPGELRMAEWREFDLANALWVIPAARAKMRRDHEVPLAPQAVAILSELHALTGRGRLVFPGLRTVERPISENTLNASMRRMGYTNQDVTAHGFRATASTLLNQSGKFSPDAIERALAHQDPDAVRRAYNRGAYWNERVEMAKWWADYLDQLKRGG
ncbi:integrase arm-type DNA-binding domain-containing protein [Rhabdaerophilum sp. SD176]|uniref:tyrosine-type recombinase/integrase n=1 Tax=Rhabdaerophilum sp. SD176 TaxID=2983548 RepID=UPI0024E02724|nr:integrase arm-type DNA-binding domain-containing protein [Rhabdaerophilum sp. SD176]